MPITAPGISPNWRTPPTIGRRAGERAVARINPGRLASGPMPVVFDPRVGTSLVGHLIGAISGGAIARKTSFLLDALGTAVFGRMSRSATIRTGRTARASRPFDGEGLPVGPVALVERGVLQTWLLDSASARQLGLERPAMPRGRAG